MEATYPPIGPSVSRFGAGENARTEQHDDDGGEAGRRPSATRHRNSGERSIETERGNGSRKRSQYR